LAEDNKDNRPENLSGSGFPLNFDPLSFGSTVTNTPSEQGAVQFFQNSVPDDIQKAFADATQEQNSVRINPNEVMAGTTDFTKLNATRNYSAKDHSLKIKAVRYMDKFPAQTKVASSGAGQVQMSQASQASFEAPEASRPSVAAQEQASSFGDILKNNALSALQTLSEAAHSAVSVATSQSSMPANSPLHAAGDIYARLGIDRTGKPITPSPELSEMASPSQSSDEALLDEAQTLEARARDLSNYHKWNQAKSAQETSNNTKRAYVRSISADKTDNADDNEETKLMTPPLTEKATPAISRSVRSERAQERISHLSDDTRKKQRHSIRNGLIGLVIALILLGIGGYFYVNANIQAVDSSNTTKKTVKIEAGSSSDTIAKLLKSNDLIKNTLVFELYSKLTGNGAFKSGYYQLSESMTARQIAQTLENGGTATEPVAGKITIPEGYSIDQMAIAFTVNAANTKEKTPFTSDAFLKVVKDSTFIAEMKAKYPKLFATLPKASSGVKYQLEGYLFPATYSYTSSTNVKTLVEQMIAKENEVLTPYYAKLSSIDLDVNTLLSLASYTEKEANTADDRKNVAEVFFNRINQNMPLQTNVALLYAEGKTGTATASDDANVDTSLNSPFNLYKNTGTGPGPVNSPSLASIDAVLNHAKNNYLYFVADSSTGKVYFATTLDEQTANVAKYVTKTK
jgi:UPF0755 protein